MWYVLFNDCAIEYTDASALLYDLLNVYPINTPFVWHTCSSLCGCYDCADVVLNPKACYAELVCAEAFEEYMDNRLAGYPHMADSRTSMYRMMEA